MRRLFIKWSKFIDYITISFPIKNSIIPPDQTNEEEIGSRPEKEFKVMKVKMIQNLGNRMEKIQETFNKELEELKRKQTMMNSTINEIKNSLEGVNNRITGRRTDK